MPACPTANHGAIRTSVGNSRNSSRKIAQTHQRQHAAPHTNRRRSHRDTARQLEYCPGYDSLTKRTRSKLVHSHMAIHHTAPLPAKHLLGDITLSTQTLL